ncbi:MAG: L-serine ammonia-lyase, iron-sulfur-dependent subunit beta [Oscillospiraceae bacterium]
MRVSIFSVIGPVMIGPSSSHTAGAARLSGAAAMIFGRRVKSVSFGLCGSFAKTWRGHGTDLALAAGAIGLSADDERLPRAFELAAAMGVSVSFYETEIESAHENTVRMVFTDYDGYSEEIIGSSTGGGQILITSVDGFPTELDLTKPALLLWQRDEKGIVSAVSGVLAAHDLNIAQMKLIRRSKGGTACCVIETDLAIPEEIAAEIAQLDGIEKAEVLRPF